MTVPPPGVVNFRDAGGHVTPHGLMVTGRLFRSANLMNLADPHGLEPYGIATVVDLRNDQERVDHPTRLTESIAVVDITIDPGAWRDPAQGMPRLEQVYRDMIEGCAPQLVQAVETIARCSDRPLLVHCTGGKDRTGMVVALVQALLGVDDEVIVADYARSEEQLLAAWLTSPPPNVSDGVDWDEFVASGLLASPPEIMFDVLGRVRREHGSVLEFLTSHGSTPEISTRLQNHLVGH
jgi:protein-tyrosine phosphatase